MLSCVRAHATLPSTKQNDGIYNIRAFGAVGDGRTDNTTAIQRAVDAASKHGGEVFVPVGKWLCKGHLEIKMGVHLRGVNAAPQSWEPQSGSILMPTEGRDREEGPAFLELRTSSSVSGVTIYYPEQTVDDIRPIRGPSASAPIRPTKRKSHSIRPSRTSR